MTKIPTVYLAGPIAQRSDAQCKDWRERANILLPEFRILDPMVRDYRGQYDVAPFAKIVEDDCTNILSSTAVLMNVETCGSWGTAMELRFAFERGTPIVGFSANPKEKEWKWFSPWVKFHLTHYYPALEDACIHL